MPVSKSTCSGRFPIQPPNLGPRTYRYDPVPLPKTGRCSQPFRASLAISNRPVNDDVLPAWKKPRPCCRKTEPALKHPGPCVGFVAAGGGPAAGPGPTTGVIVAGCPEVEVVIGQSTTDIAVANARPIAIPARLGLTKSARRLPRPNNPRWRASPSIASIISGATTQTTRVVLITMPAVTTAIAIRSAHVRPRV